MTYAALVRCPLCDPDGYRTPDATGTVDPMWIALTSFVCPRGHSELDLDINRSHAVADQVLDRLAERTRPAKLDDRQSDLFGG